MIDFSVHPEFLKEHGYCVYEHVFPDGKRYIGISKDAKGRWGTDGHGYDGVPKMRKAIQKTGWDNIEHNIIVRYLPKKQAQILEKYLIKNLGTIDNGYNQRTGGEVGRSLYSAHVNKMLGILRRSPYPDAKEFGETLEMFSDNESASYTVNVIDYVLRTEVDEWKTNISKEEDSMMGVGWIYYMKAGITGKDIREIPNREKAMEKHLKGLEEKRNV